MIIINRSLTRFTWLMHYFLRQCSLAGFILVWVLLLKSTAVNGQREKFEWVQPWKIQIADMCFDHADNILVTGHFGGTVDFDNGPGTFNLTSGSIDGNTFVMKLDPDGNFLWARSLYGGENKAKGISTDSLGNVYFAGSAPQDSIDFDPGPAVMNTSVLFDMFVVKLDPSGNLQWFKIFDSGFGVNSLNDIEVNNRGDVHVTGHFSDTCDFDPGTDTMNLTTTGMSDLFVVKLNANGGLLWAQKFGGPNVDIGEAITLDDSGNVYVTGGFKDSVDFDPGPGISRLTAAGDEDVFVLKLDSTGNSIFARSFGGNSPDRGNSIVVDGKGNIYTSGRFWGFADLDPGPTTHYYLSYGHFDAFVSKLSPAGNFIWARRYGGSQYVAATLGIVNESALFVSGTFKGPAALNPDTSVNSHQSASVLSDLFVSKLDTSGGYIWTGVAGDNGQDVGNIVRGNNKGDILISGAFDDTVDFDFSSRVHTLGTQGTSSFIMKMNTDSTTTYSTWSITGCYTYVSPSGRYIWNNSGIYTDTIPNQAGGDSILLINLTINSSTNSTINISSCDNYTSPSGNYTWTASGTYFDTIPNGMGCDSLITANLTIVSSKTSSLVTGTCDSYTSPSGNYTWTTSGTYFDTIPTISTSICDSIITIALFVFDSSYDSVQIQACYSYTSPSGSHIWSASGNYSDTIPNAVGCDSIIYIDLTITPSTSSTINISSCDNYTSPSGNYTWTASGTYFDTIPNGMGCDSLITANLTIVSSKTSSLVTGTCDSYTSPSGNYTWTTSGVYYDTIPTTSSPVCDSIITIALFVFESTYDSIQVNACNSYISPGGGQNWTASGIYSDTILNTVGCDSIIYIDLTIAPSTSSTINIMDCNSYTSPSGNHTWTTSGTYSDTIPNSAGCDSLITINLSIPVIDTSVSISGFSLTANALNNISTYQWLDCDNGFAPIPGATARSFTPSSYGNYAVMLTSQGCSDTSGCHKITGIGLPESDSDLKPILYPNPTTKGVTVDMGRFYPAIQVEVISSEGRVVTGFKFRDVKQFEIELPAPSGHYTLRIRIPGGAFTELQIVKK